MPTIRRRGRSPAPSTEPEQKPANSGKQIGFRVELKANPPGVEPHWYFWADSKESARFRAARALKCSQQDLRVT